MDLISTIEAAARWGVSPRNVQRLLSEGRITGAKKYGYYWLIPADAEKPIDPRRAHKQPPGLTVFTLPRQCPVLTMTTLYRATGSGDIVASSLAGDSAAQKLFYAQLAYFRGETEEAARLAGELAAETSAADVRLGCGFVLCLAAMYAGDADAWASAYAMIGDPACPGGPALCAAGGGAR